MGWRRGQAPGQDLRDRVLADAGRPARAVAAVRSMPRTGVSVSCVVEARQRLRDTGEASARPQRNRVAPRLAPHLEAVRAEVASRPSATVGELRAWLAAEHGAAVGHAAMWRALDRLGLTRGKSGSGRRSGTVRTWRTRGAPGPRPSPPSTPGARSSSTRPGPRPTWPAATAGRPAAGAPWTRGRPHGRWRTATVVAAPRAEGVAAPLVLGGAIDGPGFFSPPRSAPATWWP